MVEFDFSSYECHAHHASDDDQVSTDEPAFPFFAVQQEQSHDSTRFIQDFVGVDASAWSLLIGPQLSVFSGSDRSFPRFQPQSNSASADHVGDLQPRHQSSDRGCSQRSHGRENEGERSAPGISNSKIESQREVANAKGQVRRVQENGSHVQLRSQNEPGSMAMHGDSHRSRQQQPLGKVARATCGVHLSYTPAEGAPANSCKIDHGPNVIEARERLRSMGWTKEELAHNTVKNMVKQVAAEKVTIRPKESQKPPRTRAKRRRNPQRRSKCLRTIPSRKQIQRL